MNNPTPEEIQLFLSSLGDDSLAADLQRQIEQARALREYQAPAFTSAGGVTVANVPGAISAMFQRGQGSAREAKAQARQDEMLKNQRKIAAEYFNKLYGNAAAPAQTGYGPAPFKDGGVI
jgi:hypothetical protein